MGGGDQIQRIIYVQVNEIASSAGVEWHAVAGCVSDFEGAKAIVTAR